MAETVILQLRRGNYTDFDPQKMKPAEIAVIQSGDSIAADGRAVYLAFAPGIVKRLATTDELNDANDRGEAILALVREVGQIVSGYTTTAQQKAQEAASAATAAEQSKSDIQQIMNSAQSVVDGYARNAVENYFSEIVDDVDVLQRDVRTLKINVDERVARAYVDSEGYLVLLDGNDNQIGDRLGPFIGGGGGGGSVAPADMTAYNSTGWISKTITSGADCEIKVTWSSVEDDVPTGNGIATIKVNNVTKTVFEVEQGTVTINLKPYLSSGANNVKVYLTDTYGQERQLGFNINVISLTISSTFDTSSPFTGTITFPYVPVGDVAKTVYFILDGTTLGTQSTSASGRQLNYTIPLQNHGAHSLRVYYEAVVNGETVRSNELYYEFISIVDGNNNIIIASPFSERSVQQYTSVVIPYTVYDPANATTEVELLFNNEIVSTQTVPRSEQSFTIRANTVGSNTFVIRAGSTTKSFQFTVVKSDIEVEAETENLALYLSAQGRSNNEANPETWTFNNITTDFAGFNGTTDRWQSDEDGITVCRVSGDARLTINYPIFAQDFRATGKTIELEFATRDILNYDAVILSCMSDNRGLAVTAQRAFLRSEQSEIGTQFKEDEHIRIAFVAEKRSENRLLYIYINGIVSGVIQYPDDDDFSQVTPVNISVGSNDCTTDLYCIRVYNNNLTKEQVLTNWIADTQNGADLIDRYNHNNVYDTYGNVVISKLPKDLPYMIIEATELPQYKGDKKTCSGSFTNPTLPSKSFTFTNCQIDVQGTSSQYYERKNYKMKFNGGFVTTAGTASKYAINNSAVPVKTFTMKADVASSEGANNVELARAYNDICPYKTPPQERDSKVRQGIDGFPMVVFWSNGETTTFLGKYNFNNDKGTEEVFGFASPDESWEIKNNTSDRVIWKNDDYTGTDWLNDFEARYPDTDPPYVDSRQLAEFASWVKSTDTTQATGNDLTSPVTYGEGDDAVTYTKDTADYRLAKFKYEAGNYMEMDSTLFYYLFTELFLMVDSRAKNAFPSFMGSEVTGS